MKKKHEELQSKIQDLIRLITKNLDDYDEKYTKQKLIQMTKQEKNTYCYFTLQKMN